MPLLDTMIADLEIRLDPRGRAQKDPNAFTPGELLHLLNRAQNHVATEFTMYYVRPLQTIETAKALDANGAFDLSTLTVKILEGERGLLAVKLTGGKYCTFKTDEERRAHEDAVTTFYESEPVHWFVGKKVYVRPFAGKTIDIEYKKQPVPMAFGSPNTECELTEAVQERMVDWAEGLGYDSSDDQRDLVKADNIFSKVDRRIYTMNARYGPKTPRVLEVGLL